MRFLCRQAGECRSPYHEGRRIRLRYLLATSGHLDDSDQVGTAGVLSLSRGGYNGIAIV
jgi:hypothetical protein